MNERRVRKVIGDAWPQMVAERFTLAWLLAEERQLIDTLQWLLAEARWCAEKDRRVVAKSGAQIVWRPFPWQPIPFGPWPEVYGDEEAR